MTVGELKEYLDQYNDDYEVLVDTGDDDAPLIYVEEVYEGANWNIILK